MKVLYLSKLLKFQRLCEAFDYFMIQITICFHLTINILNAFSKKNNTILSFFNLLQL